MKKIEIIEENGKYTVYTTKMKKIEIIGENCSKSTILTTYPKDKVVIENFETEQEMWANLIDPFAVDFKKLQQEAMELRTPEAGMLINEFMKYYNITRKTVYNWIRAGKVGTVIYNRKRYYKLLKY